MLRGPTSRSVIQCAMCCSLAVPTTAVLFVHLWPGCPWRKMDWQTMPPGTEKCTAPVEATMTGVHATGVGAGANPAAHLAGGDVLVSGGAPALHEVAHQHRVGHDLGEAGQGGVAAGLGAVGGLVQRERCPVGSKGYAPVGSCHHGGWHQAAGPHTAVSASPTLQQLCSKHTQGVPLPRVVLRRWA
jgi:hypothetical protein